MSETISVIVPAYNAAAYIKEAIDSVLAQTLPPFEIIVIDDGSTDATLSVIESYQVSGKISVVKQSHAGVAAARNRGISEAHGQLIAFLDADDLWLPNKLKEQLPLFQKETVLVYSDGELFGQPFKHQRFSQWTAPVSGRVTESLIKENFIPTSSVVVRKDALLSAGLFLENPAHLAIGEDYHLWLRMSLRGTFAYRAEPLIRYRLHASQSSKSRLRTYQNLTFLFSDLTQRPEFVPYVGVLRRRQFALALRRFLATLF